MRALFILMALLCGAQAQGLPIQERAPDRGGGARRQPDILARMLAAKLSDAFGRPFVVETFPARAAWWPPSRWRAPRPTATR